MLKIRGLKVINIHWLIGKWNLHWAARKWQKQILFYWFKLWILSFRIFNIKIVYTVHDLDSHAQIFPDDKKAIAWLISKVDGLVFLNDYSASVIGIPKKSVPSRIIPEGPIKLVTGVSRNEMRQRLLVPDENILLVLVGNLQEYKGIDLLLLGAKTLPSNFSIRVAGVCQANYLGELNELLKTKALKEIDVKLDAGFLSDSDYAGYLVAADYFIYPCRNINNSGSLNSALSAGLPVIVPDTKELDWITPDSKIILHKDITGDFDFNRLFDELSTIESEQYSKLLVGASAWTENRSWEHNSSSYLALYKEVLNG
jgi:glycosyltransferase involved in cell wall biosynthesis